MNEKIIKTEDIIEDKTVYRHGSCIKDSDFEDKHYSHWKDVRFERNNRITSGSLFISEYVEVRNLVYLAVYCDVQEMYIDEHGDKYIVIALYDSFVLPNNQGVDFYVRQVSYPVIKTESNRYYIKEFPIISCNWINSKHWITYPSCIRNVKWDSAAYTLACKILLKSDNMNHINFFDDLATSIKNMIRVYYHDINNGIDFQYDCELKTWFPLKEMNDFFHNEF